MTELWFGALVSLAAPWVVVGSLLLALLLAYLGARFWIWCLAAAGLLWGSAAPIWTWIVLGVIALLFNVRPVRKILVTAPLMKAAAALDLLPTIGERERVALEAGTSWLEADVLSGRPDFKAMLQDPYPDLRQDEREFLEGPVNELCRMVDDWEVHRTKDLPQEAWSYIKDERFLGMVIPEEYGGHGFSAYGMNAVIAKLSSRSIPLAVDVMVPNSLGPGELLVHYGTEEQKDRYLPRLARGEEIPCFALTEPDAGSDAAGLASEGVVFQGDDGDLYLRLNWDKRYITMSSATTLIGLAFRLTDPGNLLGKGEEPGITVALVPSDVEGVQLGQRHDPLHTPFLNGPMEGENVVVPVDQIIGGPEQAGNGWRMLMETLAAGRGIFLPAMNTGGAKLASRVTGAYAQVRQQFGLPIGRFEGVEELLSPIGGLTYMVDALSRFTCGRLDQGQKPAVISAIAKHRSSEFNRQVFMKAMDLLGGAGIMLGPKNLLGSGYVASPIAITVEGSNIVTRSLIIFGQGLIRSHPFAYEELRALEIGDREAFDRAFWGHIGQIVGNLARSLLLGVTGGRAAGAPVRGPTAVYYRRLTWASALFALLADVALFTLGGALKKREKISGRFADALSWIYLAMCALRRFEAEGRQAEHLPFVRWGAETALVEIQSALEGILANFPLRPVRWAFGWPLLLSLRLNPLGSGPSDELGESVAAALQRPGTVRNQLTQGIFTPEQEGEPLFELERAFELAVKAQPLYAEIRAAMRRGELRPLRPKHLVRAARDEGVLSSEEFELLERAERARKRAVSVDAFGLDQMPMNLPDPQSDPEREPQAVD